MAKKFNLKEEKKKLENKQGEFNFTIAIKGETAEAFKKFVEVFKPPQVELNDFIVQLIIMGAEALQIQFQAYAQEQAANAANQQQEEDKQESQIIIP